MSRVALFGEPGSGKTTIARELGRHFHCVPVEASRAVIFPMAHIDILPKEEDILENFESFVGTSRKAVTREQAMETFLRIQKTYSADVIAKILHARYVDRQKKEHIIFSGMRGLDNARYCRLHNDVVVYVEADKSDLVARLVLDRGYTTQQAQNELKKENRLYRTRDIKRVASVVVRTSGCSVDETVETIICAVEKMYQTCRRCVNTAKNPAMHFDDDGYCQICSSYMKHFDAAVLQRELTFLKSFKGTGDGMYDVMVGVSGGKDSTATLFTMKQFGFTPLAFTFDTGYLPESTAPRAANVAAQLGADHEMIDIRRYIRENDRRSYERTAKLYEHDFTLETKQLFLQEYNRGRKHYSIKCGHSLAFVRSCQLCRRMVVRAYYGEARKRGVTAIVLGMNEWTNLSDAQQGGDFRVSGIRKLQPYKHQPPVYIFHLPFLLQRNSTQTKRILDRLGWKPPVDEDLIESNANSCLFARSTERMAKRLLGFHPDSTRLAREVTVGFITKKQALAALGKIHPYPLTPRQVLERAGILKKKK